jgi:hypothetical protein
MESIKTQSQTTYRKRDKKERFFNFFLQLSFSIHRSFLVKKPYVSEEKNRIPPLFSDP